MGQKAATRMANKLNNQFPRDCPHCQTTINNISEMLKHIKKCKGTKKEMKRVKKGDFD